MTEFKSFADAIRELAVVSKDTVYRRIRVLGWSKEEALAYPAGMKPGDSKRPMIVGDQWSMLTLLRPGDIQKYKGRKKYSTWVCLCLCREVKIILSKNIRSGATRSCGCLHKLMLSEFNTRTKLGVKRNGI